MKKFILLISLLIVLSVSAILVYANSLVTFDSVSKASKFSAEDNDLLIYRGYVDEFRISVENKKKESDSLSNSVGSGVTTPETGENNNEGVDLKSNPFDRMEHITFEEPEDEIVLTEDDKEIITFKNYESMDFITFIKSYK